MLGLVEGSIFLQEPQLWWWPCPAVDREGGGSKLLLFHLRSFLVDVQVTPACTSVPAGRYFTIIGLNWPWIMARFGKTRTEFYWGKGVFMSRRSVSLQRHNPPEIRWWFKEWMRENIPFWPPQVWIPLEGLHLINCIKLWLIIWFYVLRKLNCCHSR